MFRKKAQRHRGTEAQSGLMLLVFLLAMLFGGVFAMAQEKPTARFETRELVVDSGKATLAAWQVELKYDPATVAIVGIEGGDAAPFGPDKPPFYDPKGLTAGRIILANLTGSATLRSGTQAVARLHLRILGAGEPKITAKVMAAGTAGGARIPATATLGKPDKPDRPDKSDKQIQSLLPSR